MKTAEDWTGLAKTIAEDRRRGRRVPKSLDVEIFGFDRTGRLVNERAQTEDISETGCRIRTRLRLDRGDVVAVRLLGPAVPQPDLGEKAQLFEVMWAANQSDGRTLGALKLQEEKFFDVPFPQTNPPE